MDTKSCAGMAVVVVMAGLLSGCAGSYQARSVDLKDTATVLVNPDILKEGGSGEALYRYMNPDVAFSQYDKVIIDPVLICKQATLDAGELENYQKLANNAFVYLRDALSIDYRVVTAPEPRTMRVQFAIVDADSSKPVRNFLSTVMPIGMGLSLVKYAATGKQSGVGEITAEFRVTDASTGQLIAAAVDRRVGGKDPSGIIDTWSNADSALQYWAKLVRYRACLFRGVENCDSLKP